MMVVLCSDPRANPPLPECQALTRVVEAYHWGTLHHEEFIEPLVGPGDIMEQLFSRVIREFFKAVADNVPNEGLTILKHPAMVRVLGPMMKLNPEVRPVVMVRDPRDQVASELEVASRAGAVGKSVKALAVNLASWFDGLDTTGLFVVRYEDLVGDFPNVRRKLETHLGLRLLFDPTEQWPNLQRLKAMRKYPSWSPKYGQPMDQAGVGRWTTDIGQTDITVIERICENYMQCFGYERHGS